MKRSILSVVATLLAFLSGVGVNELLWGRSETASAPRIEAVVAEPVKAVAVPVPPAPVQPSAPESKIIYDFEEEAFYPIGTYSFVGATPKEFAEFNSFILDYSQFVDNRPVGYINVYTKDGENYDDNLAIFGSVNKRRVIFVTAPNSKTGFEYFFDGEFLRKDFDEVSGLNTAVLRGTLIKMKHGHKVAERVVSFGIEQHGC